MAEAAIIRLKLKHLNRYRLPGSTTALQGQLAILAREGDGEMEALFHPLDARVMKKSLYLGPELPTRSFKDRHLVLHRLIEIKPLPLPEKIIQAWPHFTHVIFTSKSAVSTLIAGLRSFKMRPTCLHTKNCLAIGQATGDALRDYGIEPSVSSLEQAEGIVNMLQLLEPNSYVFYPHASLARPLIKEALSRLPLPHEEINLYDTCKTLEPLPNLNTFYEVIFSSPSTVGAFFSTGMPISPLLYTPLGPITGKALAKYVPDCAQYKKTEVNYGPQI
jgi:uroporphyrinogen-III synthase